MKINSLQLENVKRIKAVQLQPSENGLTIIGGDNDQGKTSVLDAIAWALGGEKYRPSKEQRDGSVIPPYLRITMDNGLVVERKGKNSELKVTDPSGHIAGQRLLNTFVEEFALNLPKFMESSGKEKANTLLQIIGVGDQLYELEKKEKDLYTERRLIGQTADQKKKYAAEQAYYPEAPEELMSPSDLIRQQQDILTRNGENQRLRERVNQIGEEYNRQIDKVQSLRTELVNAEARLESLAADLKTASKTAEDLQDESTEELEKVIANIDEINHKVRANLDKAKAEEDASEWAKKYDDYTCQLDTVRQQKTDLLKNARLPLPELSVEDGELTYKGQKWDNMSGSQQLIVSTAIVRELNPECGFVLMDKLEQLDMKTLQAFGEWLEKENLQAIATRVSTGEECSVIIEDGQIKEPEEKPFVPRSDWNNWDA